MWGHQYLLTRGVHQYSECYARVSKFRDVTPLGTAACAGFTVSPRCLEIVGDRYLASSNIKSHLRMEKMSIYWREFVSYTLRREQCQLLGRVFCGTLNENR